MVKEGMERVKGIEPSYEAWEAAVLPLNYTRVPCILRGFSYRWQTRNIPIRDMTWKDDKLSLSDDVRKYFPELPLALAAILGPEVLVNWQCA